MGYRERYVLPGTATVLAVGLPSIRATKKQSLKLSSASLPRLILRGLWPIRSLEQFSALPNSPIEMSRRLLGGENLKRIRISLFDVHHALCHTHLR